MTTLLLLIFFLIWGSFLNMLGYRLVHDRSLWATRSQCTSCNAVIAWYDNIPIISWIILGGACRACKKPISTLYPVIELLTALLLYTTYTQVESHYFLGYFLFVSALIVTIRSDLETMLISRFVSLYAIPIGFTLSYCDLLPLTLLESILGALFGYGLFWSVSTLFALMTGKQGLGQGDIDLLAFIGSFTGIVGVWATMMIGSIVGSIVGISFLLVTGNTFNTRIPFGPFLALGAICYILWQQQIICFLIGT